VRTVEHTNRFRRDYKPEKFGRYGRGLDTELLEAVTMLAEDKPLPRRYFDQALGCEWSDHRDWHIKPDLILIYRKPEETSPRVSGLPCRFPASPSILAGRRTQVYDYTRFFGHRGSSEKFFP
jgi:mRNA interferase YafQ